MKSVYILDTPNNCKECPISKCSAWIDEERRPDECPLHSLPQPEVCNPYSFETYSNGRAAGFNRCLELIGG